MKLFILLTALLPTLALATLDAPMPPGGGGGGSQCGIVATLPGDGSPGGSSGSGQGSGCGCYTPHTVCQYNQFSGGYDCHTDYYVPCGR